VVALSLLGRRVGLFEQQGTLLRLSSLSKGKSEGHAATQRKKD